MRSHKLVASIVSSLVVALVAATPARATSVTPKVALSGAQRPLLVLGLAAGAYIPTSKLEPNFLVGVDLTVQLPVLEGKLGLGLGLAYSQPASAGEVVDSRVPGGSASYDAVMRELAFDLLLRLRLRSWSSSWSPHLGVGPVFYFLSHEVSALGQRQDETSTQVGVRFDVGVDYRVGPGALVGELRLPFAAVAQRTTGGSNVGALAVLLAYRLRI